MSVHATDLLKNYVPFVDVTDARLRLHFRSLRDTTAAIYWLQSSSRGN